MTVAYKTYEKQRKVARAAGGEGGVNRQHTRIVGHSHELWDRPPGRAVVLLEPRKMVVPSLPGATHLSGL